MILPAGDITPASEVIVRDYGHGMTADDIQDEYLPIGRNRRGKDSQQTMSKNNKVKVTGRKGLGKLSVFGIAGEMEVRAVHAGDAVCIKLRYDDIKTWAEKHHNTAYEPEVIAGRCGSTNDPDGLEIILRGLKRKRAIDVDEIRRGLARRLHFIGTNFQVLVNGQAIKPGDRVQRRDCPEDFSWDVNDIPGGATLADGFVLSGWLGFLPQASQAHDRGVDIFATEKAVELASYFNYPSTHAQFARAHLVGEIHADFLDSRTDNVGTARNSVVWESEPGLRLQEWGVSALKWAFDRWVKLRREKKEKEVVQTVHFDTWYQRRNKREQRVADRMVKLLVDDEAIESESAARLLEIVKSSVESVAFEDLLNELEEGGASITTVLQLFDEWRIIEAREHLKLADGRLAVMRQLEKYMMKGALEVQQMQPLFEKNLWLLDEGWVEANGQTTYTELLRKHCKEPKNTPEKDRRIDILGVRSSGDVTVVELKRPEKTLSRTDLDQIEHYVDWARSNLLGSGPDSPKYIRGLLIVGKLSKSGDVQNKMRRLSGDDIRVQTYADLYNVAKGYHSRIERELQKVAPEYVKAKMKKAQKK